MNYNIATYLIYLPIISFIMIRVGWLFYKNGEIFLLDIFKGNVQLVKNVNNILLIGYYLTNIGYAIVTVAYWEKISNLPDMLGSISSTIGKIVLILSVLHYNNIFWLKRITKMNIIN